MFDHIKKFLSWFGDAAFRIGEDDIIKRDYQPPLSLDEPCRYCGKKKMFRCTCKRDLDNGV